MSACTTQEQWVRCLFCSSWSVRIFVFVLSPVNQDIFSTGCLTANKRDHRDPIVCPSRLFSGPIPPRPLFSIFLKSSSIPKSAALAGLCVSTMIELSALPFPGPCGPMWEYGWPIMLSQPGKEMAKGKRQPLETTEPELPTPSRARRPQCHSCPFPAELGAILRSPKLTPGVHTFMD